MAATEVEATASGEMVTVAMNGLSSCAFRRRAVRSLFVVFTRCVTGFDVRRS